MRSMSFSMTRRQLLDGSKTVTRRLGWRNLCAGAHVKAVHKAMGLKKGERQTVFGTCEILSVRRERLDTITDADVHAEGFPERDSRWFVSHFCDSMRCQPDAEVTRIEFRFTPAQMSLSL